MRPVCLDMAGDKLYNIIAFKSCHINDIEGESAMRKRILSLLLAIIMTISLSTTVLADGNAIAVDVVL